MLNGAYIHIREPDTRAPIIHRTAAHYPRIIFAKFTVFAFLPSFVSTVDDNDDISRSWLRLVASFTSEAWCKKGLSHSSGKMRFFFLQNMTLRSVYIHKFFDVG